jgi:quercetin dioxygenase-like cupin family protein
MPFAFRITVGSTFGALALSALPAFGEPAAPGFLAITPAEVAWKPTAAIPAGGESAVLYGNPGKPGLYVTRVKQPDDYKIQAHTHPEERVYTVMSGTFYIGFGATFDPGKLMAFPPGSMLVVPANAPHFHWTRSGEAVVQISGTGPSGIAYVDRADDPRK